MTNGKPRIALLAGIPVLAATAILVGALLTGQGEADERKGPEGLTGKNVAVVFHGGPLNGGRVVANINGVAGATDANGFWVKATKRTYADNTGEDYAREIYVPWSAVSFVSILQ